MERDFWRAIVKDDFEIPEGYAVEDLVPELIGYLAEPDLELRDQFAYFILAHWLIRQEIKPPLMQQMVADLRPRLFKRIGATDNDSVFGRSFAAIMLYQLVNEDNKQEFLAAEVIHAILEDTLRFFAQERDLRGYVEGKGWAHSMAHAADVFWMLARNRHTGEKELRAIMDAIREKVMQQSGYLYVHGEDERLARPLTSAMARGMLSNDDFTAYIVQLAAVTEAGNPAGNFDPKIHSAYFNVKSLLRCWYFKCRLVQVDVPHLDAVIGALLTAMGRFEF